MYKQLQRKLLTREEGVNQRYQLATVSSSATPPPPPPTGGAVCDNCKRPVCHSADSSVYNSAIQVPK